MSVQEGLSLCDRLAAAAAGRELAALLADLDLGSLTGPVAGEVLVAQRRQAAHYTAASFDTMIELGLRDEDVGPGARRESPGEFAAEEPRALLRLTKAAADSEFWTGWALHDEFPPVMEAFRAGALDWPRARLFPEVLLNLTPTQIAVVTGRVLPDAPGLTTGQLRARLQREAMAIDPTWRKRRYADQVRNRHVEKRINPDGTADLAGRDLPLDEVCQSMANLTRLAKTAAKAGDPRPMGVIRADLYTGYLTGSYQQVTDDDIITDLLRRATLDPDQEAEAHDAPDPEPAIRATPPGSTAARSTAPRSTAARSTAARSTAARSTTGRCAAGPGLIGEDDGAPEGRPEPSSVVPDDLEPRRGRVPLPRRPTTGLRPMAGLEIRVELSTLLGWDERPGEIAGAGPVAADDARRIVARQTRGHWRYALCDADGYLIDAGVIHARPAGWLDFASPITGATVEIALTEKLLQDVRGIAPEKWARASSATGGSKVAWRPVLTAIARATPTAPAERTTPPAAPAAPAAPATPTAFVEVAGGGGGDDPSRRLPRAGLRRRVEVRHRNCVAPACRKPAAECEIDHREEWAKGGATLEENLQPLCEWHHRMKHIARWKLTEAEDHTFRWTTPNGNHIDVRPPPVIPDLPAPA